MARLARRLSSVEASVWHVSLISAVTFAIYWNALFNDFVYDDFVIVLENRWITSFGYLGEIFGSSVSGFTDKALIPNYYRPLIYVYYALAYQLFGREPFGYHLLNVVAHAVSALLVYGIVRKLLRSSEDRQEGFLSVPFMAAVLFATHPINTEAVDFIGACTELLFALFLLLSFRLYLAATRVLSPAFIGSLACFFTSALLKEPGVVLPLLLFAYDVAYRRDMLRRFSGWARYVPYGVIGLAYLYLRFNALGGLAPYKRHGDLSTYEHLVNVFPLFLQYMQTLLLPIGMAIFHPFRPVTTILERTSLAGLAVAAAYAIALVLTFKHRRHAFLALIFIAVPLLPALYVSGVGESAFADRYLYLPSVGFAFLSAMSIHGLFSARPRPTLAMAVSFLVIAGAYSVATVSRNSVWKNDLTLWADASRKAPDHPRPYSSIGDHYARVRQLDKAIEAYRLALDKSPMDVELLDKLGIAHANNGQLEEARTCFLQASRIVPNDPRQHFNLGQVYASLKRYDESIEEFRTALRLRPDYERAAKELRFVTLRKAWSAP